MEKLARETWECLKEVSWAVSLLYLVLVGLILVFGRQVGYATMAWISLGFALLIAMVFGVILGINLLVVAAYRAFKRFRGR